MPKVSLVSGSEAVQALQRLGFYADRQRGSHMIMKKLTLGGEIGCVIPMHRQVAAGTLRNDLKIAGVSIEEFSAAL